MLMFFGYDPATLQDGDKEKAEGDVQKKLNQITAAMAILYELIPVGRTGMLTIPLSRLSLPHGVGEVGYLIVTRPDGLLQLQGQVK